MDLLTLQNTYEDFFNNHKDQYLEFLHKIIEPDMQPLVIGKSTVNAIRIEDNYLNIYLTNQPLLFDINIFPGVDMANLPAIKFPLFNPLSPSNNPQSEMKSFLIDSFWDFWSFCHQNDLIVSKANIPMFQSVKNNVSGLIKPSTDVVLPVNETKSFRYQKNEVYTIINTFNDQYLIYPKSENISNVLICNVSDIENLQLVFPNTDLIMSNKKG